MTDALVVELRPGAEIDNPTGLSRLTSAIARGAQALKREQRADGSWDDHTDLGPSAAAMHFIVESAFGGPSASDQTAGASYLLAAQQPDGSFLPFPFATAGTPAATALCRAGLLVSGLPASHPALVKAQSFIDQHGGHAAVTGALRARGDLTGLFLLSAGVVDGSFLPPVPPELALTPFDRLIDRKLHYGNIVMALVMCALVAKYARAAPTGFLGRTARAAEMQRIQYTLFQWQNDAGDWNGQSNYTWLILLGLAATGLPRSDPRIARALSWLQGKRRVTPDGLTYDAMGTDVWSTAFSALALHAAGESHDDETLSAARRYLLGAQCRRPMPVVNQRKPGAVRTGGWGFQRGNETMPDSDDTGIVLATLSALSEGHGTREVFSATEAGMAWLRDMQNPGGGFASYVWNLPSKRPGPMYLTDIPFTPDDPGRVLSFFLNPPAEFSDPALEGVTGRVLWGLGACGVRRDDPLVCRAIQFLREQQCGNGAWWGRWMTCYLVETATTLIGLAAVGEDMRTAYVENAIRFLCQSQNADGGFGESHLAYSDPNRAGQGPSTPPVTGFVLAGLLAVRAQIGEPEQRAANYLLENQLPSGTWSNAGWLHTMIPPDSFYVYELPAKALPLYALSRYRARLSNGA
ncbi:MAG TPA: prenyltransferase/squalene oxidase repeat-containing protein [Polyangiaceae bacterium]|nr:prenyltransferase/squalene oxidase repeat-containing protein [Polyangiaceae bacterium]